MRRVLVPVADGSEEMETTILVDVLRRAGCEVVLASAGGHPVVCSRGVRLIPDADLHAQSSETFDALAIPGGGPGTEALAADRHVLGLVRSFAEEAKWVGAICAAPRVLRAAGVLNGCRFTCHPGVRDELPEALDARVVEDGNLLTSQGPGSSFEFALALATRLVGEQPVRGIEPGLVLP